MIRTKLTASALAACMACLAVSPATAHEPADRTLLWADEFNEDALDRDNWIVVGTDFWVNNEQQAYVDMPEVLSIVDDAEGADGGALMLRPVYKPGVDPHPERQADFLSGRIESQGKFDFTYGRAEARIRMPDAVGVWPAFWALGNGQWPETGEIDIMEYVGEKDWVGVALHGPGYSGETPLVNKYYFPEGEDVTDWHVYAVEWEEDQMLFQIDGRTIYRVTRPMVENYGDWRFDNPKYLILNFAMGGAYPFKTNRIEEPYNGVPQSTVDMVKADEVAMLVDWVRVYAPEDPVAE
ncbi:glycoside hydrolase family 16 protein [Alteriqipengyuania lutimaris]|uniref:Glycoside hydrolase family 16 protein n=1 Tax=Alteriqipengyuania lutimaris TaxID=1538146 RepID=A0A395LL78_9SPHN|nr:glycoside hydrolase family 16 protein [Alteriqipengyuania lutimaris]MBB3035013.1 beta-glucanase (GH16 family) [Alteriqipengyuania lutimaris]RDS76174.1 glycoside hydrolase family 16 protein [Alteriqipengyuania lutimaris]